jgi:DNA-binding transcriptional regulator YiaG
MSKISATIRGERSDVSPRTATPPTIDPRAVRGGLALSYERMARLLDVSSRTVERMEADGRPPRRAGVADRLGQLARIVELGALVYTPEGFRRFLTVPQPRFGGLTAFQLIERGEADRVIGALATDYEGSAT